jgi:hypothetical protein
MQPVMLWQSDVKNIKLADGIVNRRLSVSGVTRQSALASMSTSVFETYLAEH